jgi:hypothetical protein
MKATLSSLIKSAEHIPAPLVRAVVSQLGGWESFKGSAHDITNHGISGGFCGFIYHSDTCQFARKHRADIALLAEEQASQFGEDVLTMIQNFNCVGKDYSTGEIGRCLYGRGDDTQILNGLAWYAGEEVSRAYTDLLEREGEE